MPTSVCHYNEPDLLYAGEEVLAGSWATGELTSMVKMDAMDLLSKFKILTKVGLGPPIPNYYPYKKMICHWQVPADLTL